MTLSERLRAWRKILGMYSHTPVGAPHPTETAVQMSALLLDTDEAAARLDALEAENDRLRVKFEEIGFKWGGESGLESGITHRITTLEAELGAAKGTANLAMAAMRQAEQGEAEADRQLAVMKAERDALKTALDHVWGALEPECGQNRDGTCGPNCELRAYIWRALGLTEPQP